VWAGADARGGAQALVGAGRRHTDIHERDVRVMITDAGQVRFTVGELGGDLDAVVGQQQRDARADQRRRRRSRLARDLGPDRGTPGGTVLGPERPVQGLDAVAQPGQPAADRRVGAAVTVVIDRRRQDPADVRPATVAALACACLTTFVSASQATK